MQSYRCHQAIQTLGEFFGFVKETIRVAGIEQHRAKLWMLQQCKHRREVDAAPASAGDGEVLGGSAIACVKDVDFHKIIATESQRLRDFLRASVTLWPFPSTIR